MQLFWGQFLQDFSGIPVVIVVVLSVIRLFEHRSLFLAVWFSKEYYEVKHSGISSPLTRTRGGPWRAVESRGQNTHLPLMLVYFSAPAGHQNCNSCQEMVCTVHSGQMVCCVCVCGDNRCLCLVARGVLLGV